MRFVQIFLSGQPWDTHSKNAETLKALCARTDQPSAALVLDLKQRGLLDDTIVLWTGEFGRLPISQGTDGRDHNRHAFSLWLAGGGFKRGYVHGATDDFGYESATDVVRVHDLHATLLHALGLDHATHLPARGPRRQPDRRRRHQGRSDRQAAGLSRRFGLSDDLPIESVITSYAITDASGARRAFRNACCSRAGCLVSSARAAHRVWSFANSGSCLVAPPAVPILDVAAELLAGDLYERVVNSRIDVLFGRQSGLILNRRIQDVA